MRKQATLVGMMLMFFWLPLSQRGAAAQTEERSWTELPIFIVGREIALALPDLTYVQGKALAIRADGLDMDVKKTSDGKLHPKGKTSIPRASVSVIELRTKRRGRFPLAAKVVGGAGTLGGMILGGVLGNIGNNSGDGNPILIGMAAGAVAGAVGGVLLGRQLDMEEETVFIRVVPDTPDVQAAPASGASRRSDDRGYWRVGSEAVVDSMSASPRRIWPR